MHILFDFIPIALFFIFFKLYDIYVATAVAMLTTILQIAYMWFRNKQVEKAPIITLVVILILGGATLFFHNELFIKWKPTVIYWALSLIFIGSNILNKGSMSQRMLAEQISVSNDKWQIIDKMVVVFFLFLGSLNIYIAYSYNTEVWVNFKLFGTLAITLLFCVGISCYIAKNAQTIESQNEN